MEIISIPIRGSLRHQDSMENQHVIETGDIQLMSAGTGITHSEYNHSETDLVNFLQIWVLPKERDIEPRYEQKKFDLEKRQNQFQNVVSPDREDGVITINQDVYFSLAILEKDSAIRYPLHNPNNGVYLFVIAGEVTLGEHRIEERDGVGISNSPDIDLMACKETKVLCIETPFY